MTPEQYEAYGIAPDYKEDKHSKGLLGYISPFFEGGSGKEGDFVVRIVGGLGALAAKIGIEYPLRFTGNALARLNNNLPIYKGSDHRARARNIAKQCEKRLKKIEKIKDPEKKAKALRQLYDNLKFHKTKTNIEDRAHCLDNAMFRVARRLPQSGLESTLSTKDFEKMTAGASVKRTASHVEASRNTTRIKNLKGKGLSA